MYCPINEPAVTEDNRHCISRCCRLYNAALAFLIGIILAAIGLILGTVFYETLTAVVPILIAATVILFIIFLVTLITRGCCHANSD